MHHILQVIQAFADSLGGSGLALVAFIDSSFIPLPEGCDFQIVYLTIQHPDHWLYYALMATVGSIVGSYILYAIARKGGEAFLRKRFHERHIDNGLAAFRRYGVFAIVVPAMLPPPMPFKIFILLAGMAGVSPLTFIAALGAGRFFRYGSEAILTVFYGAQVADFIKLHLTQVSIWAGAVALVIAGVAYLLRQRRAT